MRSSGTVVGQMGTTCGKASFCVMPSTRRIVNGLNSPITPGRGNNPAPPLCSLDSSNAASSAGPSGKEAGPGQLTWFLCAVAPLQHQSVFGDGQLLPKFFRSAFQLQILLSSLLELHIQVLNRQKGSHFSGCNSV